LEGLEDYLCWDWEWEELRKRMAAPLLILTPAVLLIPYLLAFVLLL
jgi:hypothetical protein